MVFHTIRNIQLKFISFHRSQWTWDLYWWLWSHRIIAHRPKPHRVYSISIVYGKSQSIARSSERRKSDKRIEKMLQPNERKKKKIKSSLIILTTYVTEFSPHNFISCLTPFEHIESNLLRSKHRNSGCLMEYTGPTQTNRKNKVYAVDFLFSFARIPQSSIYYCVYVCMVFANIINWNCAHVLSLSLSKLFRTLPSSFLSNIHFDSDASLFFFSRRPFLCRSFSLLFYDYLINLSILWLFLLSALKGCNLGAIRQDFCSATYTNCHWWWSGCV